MNGYAGSYDDACLEETRLVEELEHDELIDETCTWHLSKMLER